MDEPPKNTLVSLADNGDLILDVRNLGRVKSRSFLVSSHVLIMTSPVFAAMLGPKFKEGQQLQHNVTENVAQPPTIALEEDDVDAMDFILSSIHYKADRTSKTLTAREIVEIAVQSDKYDFHSALIPWIRVWCHPDLFPVQSSNDVQDMGYGLLVAYLFRSPNLEAMSAKYIKDLPSDFAASWKKYKFMSSLPRIVPVELAAEITRVQKEMRFQVLSKVDDLQLNETPCVAAMAGWTTRSHAAQYVEILKYHNI
ncbi:hypothetical protein B0I37DRAFT_418488 [Chaetomium sp. MPI-CAGE-AT-0009]|nr:hypothetical protein B0I37DRAFT_418488 [Chaetomium sp. MPI-CAGE-AT-0009]